MSKKNKKQKPIQQQTPKRKMRTILIPFLVAVITIGFASYLYFCCTPPLPRDYDFNKSQNAAWVRHQWFSEPIKNEEFEHLVKQLNNLEIRTIYVHVGPLNARGEIPGYDPVIWRNNRKRLKERLPDITILAWLGGINSTKFGKASDTLDMTDKALMRKIAGVSGNLVNRELFDGIHYDIEPLPDSDQGFLFLLEKTREVVGKKTISTASPFIASNDHVAAGINHFGKNTIALWGPGYYRKVAALSDEIAVMTYDSMALTPASYRRFLMHQVSTISAALQGTSCRLLVGIPTYEDETFSHKPDVENLKTALEGTVLGIARIRNRDNFQGVAIYALWTTDAGEVAQYRQLWLRKE